MTKTQTAPETIVRQFVSEKLAVKYWKSMGEMLNGKRVIKNEIEYLKNGGYEVTTVYGNR